MSKKQKLLRIKKPGHIGFLSYLADTQGCGTIRVMYPYMLLNHYKIPELKIYTTFLSNYVKDVDFYKSFTFVQFQRAATQYHIDLINHFKTKVQSNHKIVSIYEIDDLLINIPEWNYAHQYYRQNVEYVKKCISMTDGVIVSTEPLRKIYSEFNRNISVVPNHLPKFVWGDIHKASDYYAGGKIKILWAGSQNHFANKDMVKHGLTGGDFGSELMKFIKKTTDVYDWNLMGAMPVELESVKDKIKYTPWCNIFQYPSVMKSIEPDICIAPLENNIFNKYKCIVGDSLVITPSGIKNIENIYEDRDEKVSLETSNFDITDYYKYENVPTIKITTKDMFEVEGAHNHRIKNSENKWIMLGDIKIGDLLKIKSFDIQQTEYQHIVYPLLLTKAIRQDVIDNSDNEMLPRIIINEKWGRLMGYIIGDGYCNSGNSVSISCDKRYPDVVEDVCNLFHGIGLRTFKYYKKNKGQITKPNGVDIGASSRNLRNILEILNFTGVYGKVLEIPAIILRSPKSVIREFLRGLFEADGTVNNGCNLVTKSEKLAKQVQFTLLGFHIKCRVAKYFNKQYQKYYYRVVLNREAADLFYERIGFISERKSAKLKEITEKPHSNRFKLDDWNDEVVSITYGTKNVYDIEVKGKHRYISNGFMNHNSDIKHLEYVACGAAGVFSDIEPYKNCTMKASTDEEMISMIEKLAGDIDLREKVWKKDYKKIHQRLWWEEHGNLRRYVETYLNMFGRRL